MLMGVRFSNSSERTSDYSLILFQPSQFFSRGDNYEHNIPLEFPMFNCSVVVHIPLLVTHGSFGNLVQKSLNRLGVTLSIALQGQLPSMINSFELPSCFSTTKHSGPI